MSILIDLAKIDNELRISSADIATNIGVENRAVTSLIRKHGERLSVFGQVTFEMSSSGQKRISLLNEDQAIFILTLCRNSEVVVDFKHALVKAFSRLRKKQAIIDENHAKAEWQQNRELGKLTHRDNTDTIKDFISYATAQGSQGYQDNGYKVIGNLIKAALSIDNRDDIDEQQLHLVATACLICDVALEHGMAEGLPYKSIYKQAKHNVELLTSLAMIKATGKKEAPTSEQTEGDLDNAD